MNTDPDLIVIAAPVLTIIVALVIPLINGLLTKVTLPGAVKGVITILLNAIWAFIATATTAEGTAVFSRTTLYTAVLGSVISVVTYFNIYKPMKLTSSTPEGKLGPNTGIGS